MFNIRIYTFDMHSFKECGNICILLTFEIKIRSLTYQDSSLRVEGIFSGRKNPCHFEASISSRGIFFDTS